MKNLRVLFICKDFHSMVDGAQIYDYKLSDGMRSNGCLVTVYFVKYKRRRAVPFWKSKVDRKQIKELKLLKLKYDKVIVSHESLGDLAVELAPDLFILHNVFSAFYSKSILLNLYYKFYANMEEKKIIANSGNVLVLSIREKKHLEAKYGVKVINAPPGLRSTVEVEGIDFYKLKLTGSSEWLPKKNSKLNVVEKKVLSKCFDLCHDDIPIASSSLIEEDFKAGFKLKLLQMLFDGDYVFSRVDLSDEIRGLGLRDDLFHYVDDISNMKAPVVPPELWKEVVRHNRKVLLSNCTWSAIAERIVAEAN